MAAPIRERPSCVLILCVCFSFRADSRGTRGGLHVYQRRVKTVGHRRRVFMFFLCFSKVSILFFAKNAAKPVVSRAVRNCAVLHNSPEKADNTHANKKQVRRLIYESYRYCQTHRRPWPRRHPQRDPPHSAYPRGRPVADDVDMVGAILLRNAGFVKTAWLRLYIMTNLLANTVRICKGCFEGEFNLLFSTEPMQREQGSMTPAPAAYKEESTKHSE